MLLVASVSVNAQWQDPLKSPAMTTMKAHTELLLDVTLADARVVAVGAYGNIIYSDDDGVTWRQAQVPVSVTLTAVNFIDQQHGWAVGHDGVILTSMDSGETWQVQFDGYAANEAMAATLQTLVADAEDQIEQMQMSADDGQVDSQALNDARSQLDNLALGYDDALYDVETGSTRPFLDVEFVDAQRGFAIGAYGMAFMTNDGGQTWKDFSQSLPNPFRMHLNAISVNKASGKLSIVGESGMMFSSNDNGDTWQLQPVPYTGSLFGLLTLDAEQWLFGLRGHVFHSVDNGNNWQEVAADKEQTLMNGVFDQQALVLVGNGGLVLTKRPNETAFSQQYLAGRESNAAVIKAQNNNYILAGEYGIRLLSTSFEPLKSQIRMVKAGDKDE
ncbi:MAG: YCF48-related protein [Oleibacter sp.]|nr:YCF48-related protein [Thalassolituus sp.]